MHSTHHTPDPARSAEELFRAHNEQLVSMLQRRLGISREVAEDAVGLAWLQFLRAQPAGDRLVGWLYTVAKHEAFAQLGRSRGDRRRLHQPRRADRLASHAWVWW
jgi:DNA-directed RNA polymerase specialized sigma24 family protein